MVFVLLAYSSLAFAPATVSGSVDLSEVGIPDFLLRSNVTIYVPDDIGDSIAFMNPDLSYRKVGDAWAITGVSEILGSEIKESVSTDEERNVYVVPPDEDIANANGEWGLQKFGGERTYLNKTLGLGNDDFSVANFTYNYDSAVNVSSYPYLVLTNMRSISTTANTTITLSYTDGAQQNFTIFNDFDANARDRWWKLDEHVLDQVPFTGVQINVTNVAMDKFLLFKSEDPITDARYTPFYFGSTGATVEGVAPSFSPELEMISASMTDLTSPVNQRPIGMSSSEWLDGISTSEFLASSGTDIELEKFEDQRTFGWETTKNQEWDVLAELARLAGLTVDVTLEGTQQYPSVIDDYEVHWARSKFSIDGASALYIHELIRAEADSSRSLETVIESVRQKTMTSASVAVGTGGAQAITDILGGSIDIIGFTSLGEAIMGAIHRSDGGATSTEMDITADATDTTAKPKFDNMATAMFSGASVWINEGLGGDATNLNTIAGFLAIILLFAIIGVVVMVVMIVRKFRGRKK